MTDALITIRPARRMDARVAAGLLHLSMGEFANVLFAGPAGRSADDAIAALFACDAGRFSYRYATTAEVDGQAVGLLLAYPAGILTKLDLVTGRLLLPILGLAGSLRLARQLFPFRSVREAESGEYYISNLAVLPRWQRHGIGARLLAHADEKARTAGLQKCSLMVGSVNAAAVRLYERMEYRIVRTYRVRLLSGTMDISHCMVKILLPIMI